MSLSKPHGCMLPSLLLCLATTSLSAQALDLTFEQATDVDDWQLLADAAGAEATASWVTDLGNPSGALMISAINTSEAGRAYIFQLERSNLDFAGSSELTLTFDLKVATGLVGTAVHLQTNVPGAGVENHFDLQAQGLNPATWTPYTITLTNVAADASTFTMHFNLAAGAFAGAGGDLLIDNIVLGSGEDSDPGDQTNPEGTLFSFDDEASTTGWMPIADANSDEASRSWAMEAGNPGGAHRLNAVNTSEAGRAYIFQADLADLDYAGATSALLTFDLKVDGELVGTAVHLQTNVPGPGVQNHFDLQTRGLNPAMWTSYTIAIDDISPNASTLSLHFNLAAGAFVGAGGTLLVDNIALTPESGSWLDEATALGDGRYDSFFGQFTLEGDFINHEGLGWFSTAQAGSAEGFWFYSYLLEEWLYFSPSLFPAIWGLGDGVVSGYYYYFDGGGVYLLYDYVTGEWMMPQAG